MKRIHLFEFEDQPWFPRWIRICMTRYIMAFHKLLGTAPSLATLVRKAIPFMSYNRILDLCSGSAGPMIEVVSILNKENNQDIHLTLSDRYPDTKAIAAISKMEDPNFSYMKEPINAAKVEEKGFGLWTLVCSLHHMKPATARNILQNAQQKGQPILIYEISDNSAPIVLWWLAIPIAFLMVFFITPFVRPITWQQIVFTYLKPILPLLIAWDGAISNARTYTLSDLKELISGLEIPSYGWEMGEVAGRGGKKLYLFGFPIMN
jgi:hypothetical protein